jgi:hypothetical protein
MTRIKLVLAVLVFLTGSIVSGAVPSELVQVGNLNEFVIRLAHHEILP